MRIQNNAEARARAGEDAKTYDEFLAEEQAEMHSSTGDPASLDMAAVKRKSDLFLVNDNTDLQDFQDFITEQLFGEHDPVITSRPVHSAEQALAQQSPQPPVQPAQAPVQPPQAQTPPQIQPQVPPTTSPPQPQA
jgi:hypothetical protein